MLPDAPIQVGSVECGFDGGQYTVQNIQEALRHMLQQWSLATERQGLFVTDNGENMVATLQAGKMKEVQCMAPTINLVEMLCRILKTHTYLIQ